MRFNTGMKYLLFSGHMIDSANRKTPRFPALKEKSVQKSIVGSIKRIKTRFPEIKGIAGGTCGGDILFHEACLHNQVATEMIIPFPPDEFSKQSVAFAGPAWTQRSEKLLAVIPCQILPDAQRSDYNIWEHTNLKMMDLAFSYSNSKPILLALWDMLEENKPGGTYSMIQMAMERGMAVQLINIKNL